MFTKKIELYLLSFTLPFMVFGCNRNTDTDANKKYVITIATDENILRSSSTFLKQFSTNHPNYSLNVKIYNEDYLKNLIRHNSVTEDIYLVDDLLTINLSKDNFVDYTLSESFGNYSEYIKNYIKAEDENIYCLPGIGSTYSYCLNIDLFEACNLTIPSTITELKDFASNSKNYAIPFGTSFSDNNFYLDAFFQMTIPGFFSSVKGSNLFNEFVSGKTQLSTSSLATTFENYLNNIYLLTSDEFYDDSITSEQSIKNFINGKQFILSISPKFDFEEYYKINNCTFNYVYYPFLGSKKNNGWICAKSSFYLATNKNTYKNKTEEIDEFVKYYSSLDGQQKLLIDEYGNKKNNYFSYLSMFETSDEEKDKYIKETIKQSHVYLVDQIGSTFEESVENIAQYANDEISISILLEDFDYNNQIQINYKNNKYTIEELKRYSTSSEDDLINTLKVISYSIKNKLSLDTIIIDESFLKYPILDGTIYESELNSIFDNKLEMQYVNIKGSEFKKIIDYSVTINDNFSRNKRESYDIQNLFNLYDKISVRNVDISFLSNDKFLLCGASLTSGTPKKYLLGNKKEIEDDKTYYLALPIEIVDSNQFELIKGNTFNLLDVFLEYLRSIR